jgi:fanconi anemia group J protein
MNEMADDERQTTVMLSGYAVNFPFEPYGTQLAFMSRVLAALKSKQDALLESPTGTGKSLSLLCAALAFQRAEIESFLRDENEHNVSSTAADIGESMSAEQARAYELRRAERCPRIFYGTRTHSQLTQVVGELRKAMYRPSMTILASRKHYCIQPAVDSGAPTSLSEQCKRLSAARRCTMKEKMGALSSHASLRYGGANQVWDIEDFVSLGERVRGCPYFAAKSMAVDAELVLCPYNYLMSPTIRAALELKLDNAIVILDEAHNVEDVARDAASMRMSLAELYGAVEHLAECGQVHAASGMAQLYEPLYQIFANLYTWANSELPNLDTVDFQSSAKSWPGAELMAVLDACGIDAKTFGALRKCFDKLPDLNGAADTASSSSTEASSPTEREIPARVATLIQSFFVVVEFLMRVKKPCSADYRLVLEMRSVGERDECSLQLLCMNPAVAFSLLASCRSVLLTSGTLAPMDSFATELGRQFPVRLSANHVVDGASQVFVSTVGCVDAQRRDATLLNTSFRSSSSFAVQDSLAESLVRYASAVPLGMLCFLPSYALIDRLVRRWQSTGAWARLQARKTVVVEPHGPHGAEQLDQVMARYYRAIGDAKRSMRVVGGRLQWSGGALFLAVFRGKVSEGIDFSDANARCVICAGVPYPHVRNLSVSLKRAYNDSRAGSLLSGSQWYQLIAYRALNQALGRCIRHRDDFGAIVLLDERFQQRSVPASLSKWLRPHVRNHRDLHASIAELERFFNRVYASPVGQRSLAKPYQTSHRVAGSGTSNRRRRQHVSISSSSSSSSSDVDRYFKKRKR